AADAQGLSRDNLRKVSAPVLPRIHGRADVAQERYAAAAGAVEALDGVGAVDRSADRLALSARRADELSEHEEPRRLVPHDAPGTRYRRRPAIRECRARGQERHHANCQLQLHTIRLSEARPSAASTVARGG